MTYDKRRIEKSQYVLGVKPRTLGAPIAAQAGDEPMAYTEQLRAAVETVCEGWTLPAGARKTLEAALWAPQVSPRATPAVTDALQVCVKALEFRKERSANDEFALNLARIALAGSPCATADVERDAARYRWLRERPYSDWKRIAFNTMDDHPFAIRCRDEEIDAAIATTKPGA